MPMYQDIESNFYYGQCDWCGMQSELIGETDRISLFLLAEKYGWFVMEDNTRTCCCVEHWDAYEIKNIERVIGEYGSEPDLN